MSIRIALGLTIAATAAAPMHAQTVVLGAEAEATILDSTSQAMGVGALFTGTSNNRLTKRGLIRFDLSALPAGEITSATLELTPRSIRGPVPVSVYRITREWHEGPAVAQGMGGGLGSAAGPDDVTWLSNGFGVPWTNAGGDFDPVSSFMLDASFLFLPVEFDVTTDVIDMVEGTVQNHGWILVSDIEEQEGVVVSFGTDDTPDPAPRLIIEITPVCIADVNGDGELMPDDFTAWIAAFNTQAPECDQNGDGACSPTDFTAWLNNFNAGCD